MCIRDSCESTIKLCTLNINDLIARGSYSRSDPETTYAPVLAYLKHEACSPITLPHYFWVKTMFGY